jgi:uncharacterized protein YndB with AHSA1/START domain
MIVHILIAAVLLGILLAYVATRPDTFRVQRTVLIEAPPEQIFPYLEDFRKFSQWSPYEQLDPAMVRTYSGARAGKGAVYEWGGNSKVGKGRMEIAHTASPRMAVIRLDSVRPFETQNIVEFTLQPEGASTRVTWAMRGANPYIAKLIQLVFSMDRMVGKDFEAGLENLKTLTERRPTGSLPHFASQADDPVPGLRSGLTR